ncbi:class I adenylate-forming enzyme family protein [Halomarina halobia]|uniref:Class I adenylate-forming enzyme family protein n=1 Tax=Halomarina halobia TaxID=3033386 RepID=A0ABD6AEJ9_9EURY|nr:AMP-binding protein [Halomarina sp. PSR21]
MLRWPDATIYQGLSEIATRTPDAPAVLFDGEETTYGELIEEARAVANGLSSLGVGRGDTVAVWLSNRPEWLVTQLAASYLGAAVVAVNTRYRTHELEYMLRDSGCRVLVTEESFLEKDYLGMLASLLPELERRSPDAFSTDEFPNLEAVVALSRNDDYPAVRAFEDVRLPGETRAEGPADDPLATACIFYTSGTTGEPKGCLQTNRSLLNHSYQVGVHFGLREDDVGLGVLPFCGIWGYNVFMSALAHGLPLVVQPYFDAERTIRLIEAHGVTYCSALATMYVRMLEDEAFAPERVATLRRGATGFISMGYDEAVFDRIEAAVGFPLVQPYGLSEANSQVFVGDPEDPIERRKRVGGPMVHPEEEDARVVDPETGEELPPGEKGELHLRGYNVISGYHEKPEKTAEDIVDGWLRTGDLVTYDEKGYFYYQSRLDDALRVRGFLVTPRDIESAIDAHPDVALSQVVGVPHPRHGQVPVAFVRAAAETLDEAALVDYLDGRVADYKIPAAIRFVDEFPRSEGPHGEKIRKNELRDQVADLFE